jgi:two-component system, OmpR family, phosphate regulon response regulator PhoB
LSATNTSPSHEPDEIMVKAKILIIEDDRSLAEVLAYNCRQAGYEVLVAFDGQDGVTQAQLKSPDVVILGRDAYPLGRTRSLPSPPRRSALKDTRIVMLTAKSDESDELIGFTLGADDYVAKPFSVKVLLERVKAVLRRSSGRHRLSDDLVAEHGVTVDRRRHRASADGQSMPLTRSEFRLLDTLIRQPGRVFQRSELIDAALGEDTMVLERTIDVHIRALRSKMGEKAYLIETVRGVGYRFRDVDEGPEPLEE